MVLPLSLSTFSFGSFATPGTAAPGAPGVMPRPVSMQLLAVIGRILVGLDGWPEGHQIKVKGAGLTFGVVRTPTHVIEILFDPSTGRFDCTSCQSSAADLPPHLADAATSGEFVGAVLTGLSRLAVATLLTASPVLLTLWDPLDAPVVALPEDDAPLLPGALRRKRRR
ncbi:hypothetical protein [Roseateles sp. MS654]|uniref:hypothetical protein n=1 Tax=Roseateles sp. MS654 TaxID=3412685 RepID=UPI003C2C341C